MNFIFISPHFPRRTWQFCERLKRNGVNVLGIGDAPYDALDQNVRDSLNEYYYLPSLENYDAVYRAVAFFAFKYGRIDWIESNNEYWLQQDALLRSDFNIQSGVKANDIRYFKSKAAMKEKYALGQIPTARSHVIEGEEDTRKFIGQVGFPVIIKPENGVGAADTYKICNEKELQGFFEEQPDEVCVCEEFIAGDICSYDAIVDSKGEPLFESMTVWPPSIADIVNLDLDLSYYVSPTMPDSLRELGRRTVKAFNVFSRFVHLEFFRLTQDREGLGKQGDFVALEVNMRPAGGYTPDMINYAHSTDVYRIWADMVTFDRTELQPAEREYCCAYAGRKNSRRYLLSHEEIWNRWGDKLRMCEEMPPMMVRTMGNRMYTARLDSVEEAECFIRDVLKTEGEREEHED